jgi:hypothetical protein
MRARMRGAIWSVVDGHRGLALAGFVVATLVALMTLVVVPNALAETWPQYPNPTDTHETNSAWYPFTDTGGTAVGNSQIWVGNAPTSLTDQLSVSLGIANYEDTDVFYCDNKGQLFMQPWDFTTVPNAPTSPASGATCVVTAQPNGVGYLDACEVGGAEPDVFVFYFKGDPTLAANRTTLYWVQVTESWGAEHSVAMPSDFCSVSTWDQVPGAGATYFLHGRVAALSNEFAFISMNAGEIDTYVSNLQTPGSDGAVNQLTAWKPFSATYLQVRDVDAIPFAYNGSTFLAVSALYGEPSTSSDSDWGTLFKHWDSMQADVRVCTVGDDGSCAVTSSTSFAVTACPDPGPHNDGSGISGQSGAVNIRLVRGGVSNGPRGDVLTAMTRTVGTLDRWLLSESSSVQNHYHTFQAELLDAFEIPVDHSLATPTLGSSPQRYSGWQRRGLMSDGSNDLYEAKTVYQLLDPSGLAARNFFTTALAVDDPNGPTNTSQHVSSSSGSPLVYDSERQRIFWATATDLDAHGVNVKNLDDLNDYPGVVGAVGCLDSDALQPVESDTTDQDGDPLSTPISYPYPIPADTSNEQLIGIIYGSPPTSLNSNPQAVIFPSGGDGVLNTYSSVLFSQDQSAGTTTIDTTSGSAGFSMSAEGEKGHFKFPFEPELSWTTDREDVSSNKLTIGMTQTLWPGATGTPTGYALVKQVSDFELQRYARRDWAGGDIGNGVSESIFVTNPLPTSPNGLDVKPFNLTSTSSDATFAGMKSRFDTLSPKDWYGVDPLGDAQQGDHGDLFDDGDGGTTADLSHAAGGGYSMASFTESGATQKDTVSNGVSASLKIPFFKGDCDYTHKVLDSTSTTTKTVVSVSLAQPPQGMEATLQSIEVTAYWLRANDAGAYWIPDAFKTNGNYQTPWCIDYAVASYESSAEASNGTAAATPQCRVAVRCEPASGGSARVLDQQRMANGAMLGTAGPEGQLIKAIPAPGFRFTGWKLHGTRIARLASAHSQTARVSALGSGGVTAVAKFARIVPRSVQVVRHSGDCWSVSIDGAPLWDRLARVTPFLDGTAATRSQPLRLCIGSDVYRVPAAAWHKTKRAGHTIYTKQWRPRGWSARSLVVLTVDVNGRRWSLDIARGSMTQPLVSTGGGGLPVLMACPGQALQPAIPVACKATFKAALARPAGVKAGAKAVNVAVDMRAAKIATVVDTRHPASARFALTGVRVRRSLLQRSGMDLAINGTALHVGPFKKDGNAYVASGRLADGVHTKCRYTTAGAFSLTLTGGDLADRLRDEFMVQNVTLAVGAGHDALSGTMVPVPTSIARIRPVPATGELAR